MIGTKVLVVDDCIKLGRMWWVHYRRVESDKVELRSCTVRRWKDYRRMAA